MNESGPLPPTRPDGESLEARNEPPPRHLGPHRHDDLIGAHARRTALFARHAVEAVVENLPELLVVELLPFEVRFGELDFAPRPGPFLAID
jgi:hypothetical protein